MTVATPHPAGALALMALLLVGFSSAPARADDDSAIARYRKIWNHRGKVLAR
jgi:hypothetical protein